MCCLVFVLFKQKTAYELRISDWSSDVCTADLKANADDSQRPERRDPAKKRSIIFSPHPDDDVISMGGTFIRLADQGHDVHVAYQTRSQERRVGKEWVRPCISRWSPHL